MGLGAQEQEPGVAGDPMAAGLALRGGPADIPVAGLEVIGGTGPAQRRDHLPVLFGDILE